MLNLQINKPFFKSMNSELSEDDSAKLAIFVANFKVWNKHYKNCLQYPVTYLQVENLKKEIEKNLSDEEGNGYIMLEEALSLID